MTGVVSTLWSVIFFCWNKAVKKKGYMKTKNSWELLISKDCIIKYNVKVGKLVAVKQSYLTKKRPVLHVTPGIWYFSHTLAKLIYQKKLRDIKWAWFLVY